MKFIVAKCPNCGAKINMEEGKHFYKCNYCRHDIIFDDNGKMDKEQMKLEGLEIPVQKMSKLMMVMLPVTILIILTIFITTLIGFFSISSFGGHTVSTNSFNIFIDNNGIYSSSYIASTLNHVVSNMEDHDKIITVVFNGEETSDIDEIKAYILELDGYEMFSNFSILSYKDDDGYVNKLVIEQQ
ncbi:MAG: hypothetical protein R3Y21_00245 [Mycoplasmatota bacterium]